MGRHVCSPTTCHRVARSGALSGRPAQVAVMNERHRTAKRAQKDCSDLYLLLLLHSQVPWAAYSACLLVAVAAAAAGVLHA